MREYLIIDSFNGIKAYLEKHGVDPISIVPRAAGLTAMKHSLWNVQSICEDKTFVLEKPVKITDIKNYDHALSEMIHLKKTKKCDMVDILSKSIAWYIHNTNIGLYDFITKRPEVPVFLYGPHYKASLKTRYFTTSDASEVFPTITYSNRTSSLWSGKTPIRPHEVESMLHHIEHGNTAQITKEEYYRTILSLSYPLQLIADYLMALDELKITKVSYEDIPLILNKSTVVETMSKLFNRDSIQNEIHSIVCRVLSSTDGLFPSKSYDFSI